MFRFMTERELLAIEKIVERNLSGNTHEIFLYALDSKEAETENLYLLLQTAFPVSEQELDSLETAFQRASLGYPIVVQYYEKLSPSQVEFIRTHSSPISLRL